MTTLKVHGPTNKAVARGLAGLGYKVKEVLDSELPTPINAIRVCTHIFNAEQNVDWLVAALERVMGETATEQ